MPGSEKYERARAATRALDRLRKPIARRRKHEKDSHFSRDVAQARGFWNDPNILGYGVGPKKSGDGSKSDHCLVFFVRKKLAKQRLGQLVKIPARLLIETSDLEVETDVQPWGRPPVAHLAPGIQIGDSSGNAGTMTLAVKDAATGAPLILSCSHVLAMGGDGAKQGDIVESPVVAISELGANVVGRLSRFMILDRNGDNSVDAAVATAEAGVEISNRIPGAGAISEIRDLNQESADSLDSLPLRKFGAVTNQTDGEMGNLHISASLVFHELSGDPTLDFVDLAELSCESKPGDSGSPVVDEQLRIVGMLIGGKADGTSLFTHIQPVFDLLKITL